MPGEVAGFVLGWFGVYLGIRKAAVFKGYAQENGVLTWASGYRYSRIPGL